jgi:hypothetical protein
VSDQASRDADVASLRPYREIKEHAELELEMAGRGELERLAALGERWDQLTGDLPSHPPLAAAALLRGARLIHERTRVELLRLREALLVEISTSARTRRAAEGYGSQLPRRTRVDHSA